MMSEHEYVAFSLAVSCLVGFYSYLLSYVFLLMRERNRRV